MTHSKNNDFTLTHYLNLADQRPTALDQVPFFLGLKGSPLTIRRILEVVLGVNWTITNVANTASHSVGTDDVVILSGHSTTITLPSIVTAGIGRILVVKDSSGAAGTAGQSITVNRSASDTIDGTSTSFSLEANYGAIILISGSGTEWHVMATV